MGTLAQALRKPVHIKIGGATVNVKPLGLSEIHECIASSIDASKLEEGKSAQAAAQEAIEAGQLPLSSFPAIIRKAAPDLDDDDVAVLLIEKNFVHTMKILAVASGEDPDNMKLVKSNESGSGKKNKRSR